jgi:hypothetical protein
MGTGSSTLTSGIHAVMRLIRFSADGPFFLLTGVFGAMLNLAYSDVTLIMLQLFIARSTALGFLVNDIFDRALDSYESRTRNPLTERTCHLFAVNATIRVPLPHSLICPGMLRARLALAGEVGLFIFATTSSGIKATNIPKPDLAYHRLFPALYEVVGYIHYRARISPLLSFPACLHLWRDF